MVFLYLFNSETLSDNIKTCLCGNSKENKLNFWSEKMVSADDSLRNIGVDLCSLAMDYCCLDSPTWIKVSYSSGAKNWLLIGSWFTYVRLYEWDCKFIHKEHSFEDELITCFIHWVLINYYCVSSWIKNRAGRKFGFHFPSGLQNTETNKSYTWWSPIQAENQTVNVLALISHAEFSPVVTSMVNLSIITTLVLFLKCEVALVFTIHHFIACFKYSSF